VPWNQFCANDKINEELRRRYHPRFEAERAVRIFVKIHRKEKRLFFYKNSALSVSHGKIHCLISEPKSGESKVARGHIAFGVARFLIARGLRFG
jgi:hypothetical protein